MCLLISCQHPRSSWSSRSARISRSCQPGKMPNPNVTAGNKQTCPSPTSNPDVLMCDQVRTYKTIQELTQETHHAAEGTMAYVSARGGELYIRARNGWRKIPVCPIGCTHSHFFISSTRTIIFCVGGFLETRGDLLNSSTGS